MCDSRADPARVSRGRSISLWDAYRQRGGGQNADTDGTELPGENVAATEEVTEQPQTEVQTDPVEEQAAQLVSQMTLEDKIAQMFVITPNALTGYASGVTAAGDTTKEAYQSRPVGGIVYMADNLTDPEQTTTMLSNMQQIARGAHRTSGIFYVWTKRAAVSRASPAMMPSG